MVVLATPATVRKVYGCMMHCMDERSGRCVRKSECSLKFPSDRQVVQEGKKCAMENGFNSSGMQELCWLKGQ